MAIVSRLWEGPKSFQSHLVEVTGSVAITGASGAVDTQVGRGFVVTKGATGRYTITLTGNGSVGDINFADVCVVVDADAAYVARLRVISKTARTVTFHTEAVAAAGTPAHPPAGALLMIRVVCRNSSQAY